MSRHSIQEMMIIIDSELPWGGIGYDGLYTYDN
jgi:hypothetical protein